MNRKAHRLQNSSISSLRQDGELLFFSFGKSILKRNDAGIFRFSTVVSKKVAPRAIDRNRIKRQVYHALLEIDAAKLLPNVDIVLIISQTIHTKKYSDIVRELQKSIKKYNFKK